MPRSVGSRPGVVEGLLVELEDPLGRGLVRVGERELRTDLGFRGGRPGQYVGKWVVGDPMDRIGELVDSPIGVASGRSERGLSGGSVSAAMRSTRASATSTPVRVPSWGMPSSAAARMLSGVQPWSLLSSTAATRAGQAGECWR